MTISLRDGETLQDYAVRVTAERDEAREERDAAIDDAKDYMDIVRQRDALKFALEAGEAAMQHLARLQAERDEARVDLAGTKVAYESVRAQRDSALALLDTLLSKEQTP